MSSKKQPTATKEDGKPTLVPKLRFQEFRGAEAWHSYLLEELEDLGWVELGRGEVISGQDIKAIPGDYPIYSSSVKNNGLMGAYGRFMFDEELISWSVDGGGDFFHRPRHKFSVTNVSGYMRLNRSHLNYRFLASHLQALHASLTFDYQFKAHPSVIRKLYRLAIPSPAEQQKLAECLSSVDEVIAAQARKVEALNIHKKGLMQQLFPREGETQPRLRFPEFQNDGEWVQKNLGDVSEVLMCKRIFAEETNPNEGVPFYKIGTLGGVPDAFISQEKFEDYKSRYNYPRIGEVLITCSGTVGKCLPFDGRDAYFQDSNIVWLDNPTGEVSNEFLLMLLSNVNWGKLNSTTITRIYGPDLRGLAIKYPEDEAEQERIATCLSSLDSLITTETKKLEALKRHKRGLMQQLFPSPEKAEA